MMVGRNAPIEAAAQFVPKNIIAAGYICISSTSNWVVVWDGIMGAYPPILESSSDVRFFHCATNVGFDASVHPYELDLPFRLGEE